MPHLARLLRTACAALIVLGLAVAPQLAARATATDATAVARTSTIHLLGRSLEGRALAMECRGDGAQLVLLIGGMHTGRESVTVTLAEEIVAAVRAEQLRLPADVRLCVLPALNPDGLANGSRANARDVDLNRNWATDDWAAAAIHSPEGDVSGGESALSEPETRVLFDYIAPHRRRW